MLIAEYFLRFIFFSFLGWIYECLYCTIKSGKWENRGFLIGPVCPIYGFGAILAWVIFRRLYIFPDGRLGMDQPIWVIFLICALGTAIMEYSISLLLEKVFNAKWWDYSETPLNINGRICIPASCAFGVAGVVIVKYFFPWYAKYDAMALADPDINEFVALMLMMILGMDIALTEASLTSLLEILDEAQEKFDERMEAGVETIAAGVVTITSVPDIMKEKAAAGVETISAVPDIMKEKAAAGMNTIAQAPGKLKGMTPKVPKLSWRQNYHLNSIQKFTKPQHTTRARQLKNAAGTIKMHTWDRLIKGTNNDAD